MMPRSSGVRNGVIESIVLSFVIVFQTRMHGRRGYTGERAEKTRLELHFHEW
jgi:hypothetical protein